MVILSSFGIFGKLLRSQDKILMMRIIINKIKFITITINDNVLLSLINVNAPIRRQ